MHNNTSDTNDYVTIKIIASAWWNRARHQWQRDTKTQSTFHTAHMNTNTWMQAWSQVRRVQQSGSCVMIAHHIMGQVSHVRVISWWSRDERISSTLSPPFSSTSWSSHSSLISCTSSCTSSSCTTFREVVTLGTSPEKRWTPLTILASSQVMSPSPTTSRRLTSSPSQSPRPTHSSPSKGSSRTRATITPRSRRYYITHTEYMLSTPSEKGWLSDSRRRRSPNERGDLLDQMCRSSKLQMQKIRLCWTAGKSKLSPNGRWKLRNTNSRLIVTKEVYEN